MSGKAEKRVAIFSLGHHLLRSMTYENKYLDRGVLYYYFLPRRNIELRNIRDGNEYTPGLGGGGGEGAAGVLAGTGALIVTRTQYLDPRLHLRPRDE